MVGWLPGAVEVDKMLNFNTKCVTVTNTKIWTVGIHICNRLKSFWYAQFKKWQNLQMHPIGRV